METKFHKTTHRTPRYGLLSEAERNAIQNNTIRKQLKWKLIGAKKGRLSIGLKALIKDFEAILESKELKDWSNDYFVIQDLETLRGIIAKRHAFQNIAIQRLRVSRKTKTYYIDRITIEEIPHGSEWRDYFSEKMTKGLKPNEKKVISDYQSKAGMFNLPLELGKKYYWKEVKQKLSADLNRINLAKVQKVLKPEAYERANKAWKIFNSRITAEDKKKIAQLGIYFQPHVRIGYDK